MDNGGNQPEVERGDRSTDGLHLLKWIDPKAITKEEVEKLWNNLKSQDYAFDDTTRDRGDIFVASMIAPQSMHFALGKDGHVSVQNIVPKVNANISLVTWNKVPISEIVEAGRELIKYLFDEYKLNRVSTFIPIFNEQAIRLVTLLGFKYEGEIRGIFLTGGKYYNTLIYGLLRSEYLRGEVTH
ncbi:hypothetical protein LCGC14_0794470 [marine sediment metagenome]|uniref:N-acetyltransferase domain-containing protein n=1 Tax=marine sediment metagenome TaxID=412755 RepID=A0A0F9SBK1_9ZZZZ